MRTSDSVNTVARVLKGNVILSHTTVQYFLTDIGQLYVSVVLRHCCCSPAVRVTSDTEAQATLATEGLEQSQQQNSQN